jgi:hypothetical protein
MKTKSIRNIFALALIPFTVFACSRFEDGPKISLRSIKKRLLGNYKIEYFSKNGNDLTSDWNQYYDLTFDFHDSPDERPLENKFYIKTSGMIDSCGTWKYYEVAYGTTIEDKGDSVTFTMANYLIDTAAYPERLFYPVILYAFNDNGARLKLTRLTNDEIWITHTNGDDVYEIHFKE